ncbi:STAS domain-containing protein [Sphingomonas sp. RP10(2022)]|uniref:STAS domain-containing protein n=1 Tax=Sphingomonas liriopis TaxID=2949094 RepID=A0A9X2HS92_9SPHN|nr:STAS domain-containing protein [Sphingomonas liriopis]MCP3735587.1 STAS domain-containing protein [Sphingomonas liriopis]
MHHPLPATLDTSAAGPLRHALLARVERGEPLHLDGADVVRAGQACLQVLASARATAADRGLAFRIDHPSDALARMMTLARLDAALDPVRAAGA